MVRRSGLSPRSFMSRALSTHMADLQLSRTMASRRLVPDRDACVHPAPVGWGSRSSRGRWAAYRQSETDRGWNRTPRESLPSISTTQAHHAINRAVLGEASSTDVGVHDLGGSPLRVVFAQEKVCRCTKRRSTSAASMTTKPSSLSRPAILTSVMVVRNSR